MGVKIFTEVHRFYTRAVPGAVRLQVEMGKSPVQLFYTRDFSIAPLFTRKSASENWHAKCVDKLKETLETGGLVEFPILKARRRNHANDTARNEQ